MHRSKLDEIIHRLGESTSSRILVYVLILALGAALVILGYYLDPRNAIVQGFHLDSGTPSLGFVLMCLGFGGLVAAFSDDRTNLAMVDLLKNGLDEFIAASRWTLAEHLASSHLDLDVPEHYRARLHLYHKTTAVVAGPAPL